ncbi:MAG TPA: ABC transporter ATP-binding protein [Candidatus Saccharimonadia bacterium]|jgi:ABC-2 type transport system ATP-binding protein|nr:ABC transporter ATP-binding protein [Candidatus Saccharimonadia bacterium]
MAEPIIHVENLVKRYAKAKKNAVDGVSFDVMPGELFAFLGPNGAGKTTTISILTTTLSKTAGDVTIAGFDLDKKSKAVRANVGIIFQNPSLDLDLTAEENIRLHASLYGEYAFRPAYRLMPKAYQQKVKDFAELVGLQDDLFKPMKTYSGGMKRKLEIVRSLMHQPKVLFLDEPTSGLDPVSRHDLWQYLQRVRQEHGTTVFLTTHYLDEAEGADRVCVINHGKIMSLGTPDEIKNQMAEQYVLLDAADRDALRAELKALKVPFEEAPQLKVKIESSAVAQKLIKHIKSPLTTLQVNMPSLEEAYINLIKEEVE